MVKFYTGIGSRKAPTWALKIAERLALSLTTYGYTLRSGGADGMDSAFESGCDLVNGKKEIYLPWKHFNDNPSPLYTLESEVFKMAEYLHPNWNNLSDGAKKLHARNIYQITGFDWENFSKFVIYYSFPDKGGTQQALRVANEFKIRTINIFDYRDIRSDKDAVKLILNKVLTKRLKLTNHPINGFKDRYLFLSNFYQSKFPFDNIEWKSVEHAFQANKTIPVNKEIINAKNPAIAKKLGSEVNLRPDWNKIKLKLMYDLVYAKFSQSNELAMKLINTGNSVLTEDNYWHDNFWGSCSCNKCKNRLIRFNHLGKILMNVRRQLNSIKLYCKYDKTYHFDSNCTEMKCEFCEFYYDENRKQWWYHPESDCRVLMNIKEVENQSEELINIDDDVKTRVVNIKHDKYDVYIGRGSPFGNPFSIPKDGDRDEVIRKFQDYLNSNEKLQRKVLQLRNLRLGCHCTPLNCHGDVIAEFIENHNRKIYKKGDIQ